MAEPVMPLVVCNPTRRSFFSTYSTTYTESIYRRGSLGRLSSHSPPPPQPSKPSSSSADPPAAANHANDTLEDINSSPISKLFAGVVSRVVQSDNDKNKLTWKPEAFWTLDLAITDSEITTIEDAICCTLVDRDPQKVLRADPKHRHIYHKLFVETWPPILVLSLKRTGFGALQAIKTGKVIEYGRELQFNFDWWRYEERHKWEEYSRWRAAHPHLPEPDNAPAPAPQLPARVGGGPPRPGGARGALQRIRQTRPRQMDQL
mmetsp:Transcript_5836/g.16560  ORF Transcript_5836/g.16560 Transcript_5836/m.16560 type:complete len:261 (+) Transcript_5836:1016-1798(+)